MKLLIFKEDDAANFGYAASRSAVPEGFGTWAVLDTASWTARFPDGTEIRYEGFHQFHQDLGKAMSRQDDGPRETVRWGPGGREIPEEITDFAEQWGEIGDRVLRLIQARPQAEDETPPSPYPQPW